MVLSTLVIAGFSGGALGVALGGCGPDSSGQGKVGDPCDNAGDCEGDLVCSPQGLCANPDGDAGTDRDGGLGDGQVPGDGTVTQDASPDAGSGGDCPDGRDYCGPSLACCDPGDHCLDDQCVLDQGACAGDEDCQEDSYCDSGECYPYGTGPRGDFNPACTQLSIAGLFQPQIQCEFVAPPAGDPYPNHVRVLSTPLVVDFDFDGDATRIEPSIVVMTYNGSDGSSGCYDGAFGVIRVLDGATCSLLYNVGTSLNGCNTPALGDLDLDGRPEIVAHRCDGGIAAFTYDPNTDAFVPYCSGSLVYTNQANGWAGPSLADLDDDEYPEIVSGGVVYDHQCVALDSTLSITGHMYSGSGYPVLADLDGVLDSDGIPTVEMPTGSEVYRFDRISRTWQEVWGGGTLQGYVAVADFGTFGADPTQDDRLTKDGIAEIVTVRDSCTACPGTVTITTQEGRVIYGPVSMPSTPPDGGGPPTVGDFDGDGLAEVSCSGSDSIAVFDPDCRGLPDMNRCASLRTDGILWWQVSQDHSSNRTGSSLFDFEGDGRVEVIYADEVFTRVYDGQTGEVLFSQWHSSCTWNENPIVADVDGDFNAELVVPSNSNCSITPTTAGGVAYPMGPNGYVMDPLFVGLPCDSASDCLSGVCDVGYCRCTADTDCAPQGTGSGFVCAAPPAGTAGTGNTCRAEWRGQYNGVRVYADALDRWVASRTIWSQHAYAVSHIQENGTVERTSNWVQNWKTPGLNNFRMNVQGDTNASSSPDLTGGHGLQGQCTPTGDAILRLQVCNRGTQPVGAGVPVTFYEGDPTLAQVLCTEHTNGVIVPGACEPVTCTWTDPPGMGAPVDVNVVVDDDGTGAGQNSECVEGNNSATIPDVFCQVVG